jgi:putative redox protein
MNIKFHYEPQIGFKSDSDGKDIIIMKDPLNEVTERNSPTELLLYAMSGCSSYDVLLIISRMRKEIKNYKMEVDAERESEEPKTLKTVNFHYFIDADISIEQALRSINLSLEKYCSVTILARRGGVMVTFSLTLNGKQIVDHINPSTD